MHILFFAAGFGPYYDDDSDIPWHLLTDDAGMIGTTLCMYICILKETSGCAQSLKVAVSNSCATLGRSWSFLNICVCTVLHIVLILAL